MTILLTILHILVCMFLILVVLAQQGKGQDLASAFGGGGSSATFGARGTATLLSKITTGAAVLFMLTSLGLTYLRPVMSQRTVVPDEAPGVQAPQETGSQEAPATPEGIELPAEQPPAGAEPETTGQNPAEQPETQPESQPPQPEPQ